MLGSIFKTAVRNLVRNKVYATINIVGLAIGIACSFLILLHVQNECSYDKFHQKRDRIYRLYERWHRPNGSSWTRSITGTAPGWRMHTDFPEIEAALRLANPRTLVSFDDKKFYESGVFFADSSVFEVFSFKLTKGDAGTALAEPYSVVLTEAMSRKYFGDNDPLGKIITFDNSGNMTVTGILEDVPNNSHLKFDCLASLSTLINRYPGLNDSWDNRARTYLLVGEGTDPENLEEQFSAFVQKYRDEKIAARLSYGLQPLPDVHWEPTDVDLEDGGQVSMLLVIAAIAAMVLMIAILNFVNLSTAMYTVRVGEVSVRKVCGADRTQLTRQFMGESLVLVLLAVLVAVALAELFLPVFQSLTRTQLAIDYISNPLTLIGLAGLTIVVALAGGSYPAFVLSRLNPVDVLRRTMKSGRKGAFARRALVVFQFAVSAGMILGALVVYSQLEHLVNKDLGFDTESITVVPVGEARLSVTQLVSMKTEIARLPGVRKVALSSDNPCAGDVHGVTLRPQGGGEEIRLPVIFSDQDYIPALGLSLVAGRNFSGERIADERHTLIVNEAALAHYGDRLRLGHNVTVVSGGPRGTRSDSDAEIIGVLKDFNFRDLRDNRIGPLAVLMNNDRVDNLLIRIEHERAAETIADIGGVFNRIIVGRPFQYSFLEDDIEFRYQSELRQSSLFGYSSLLAIFVALIGLFGLALYTTRQRTKEIGIRKVFGATAPRIVAMISAEITMLVCIANLVALPVAYYLLNDWLNGYSYRMSWSIWHFASAMLVSLLSALLTVGYLSFRAASADPVDSLRYE